MKEVHMSADVCSGRTSLLLSQKLHNDMVSHHCSTVINFNDVSFSSYNDMELPFLFFLYGSHSHINL